MMAGPCRMLRIKGTLRDLGDGDGGMGEKKRRQDGSGEVLMVELG